MKHFLIIGQLLTFISLTSLTTSIQAANGDAEFLRARQAFDNRNAILLSDYSQQLQYQNYLLAPYAQYWLMLLNLKEADNQTVIDFINETSDYPFADKLRGELLKKLAKEGNWQAFVSEYPNYKQEDAAVACYAAEANAITGDTALLAAAKDLWLQALEQPSNCESLYDRMQAAKVLNEEDIWARFRLSLAENRTSLAKSIAKRSQFYDANYARLIDKTVANPAIALVNNTVSFNTQFGRELNLFALIRLSKTNSQQAFNTFKNLEPNFLQEEKAYFYGQLAYAAAKRHEPQALQWFKLSGNTLNKETLAWYARAALREKNWLEVKAAINKMDESQSQEGAWRYWKARALKSQQQVNEANSLFAKLSTERHFYGWLAQDELDGFMTSAPISYKVSNGEVQEIANTPAFARADALQRLDLKWEAKAEWAQATKGFDDKQLLAAAEFASRKNWHDLAISTADKTTQTHDFGLRYPTPYRDLIRPAAEDQGIDESWVYGITRQESRFMHYAKSGVGASGLMQLMPATAKWIAKRAGVINYHNGMIKELGTNVALGTYYLRYTLELMNDQAVMATAAYNAGPSRAKKWMANVPLEGAIYAETIPFNETRSYVQKVMANAHIYAHRLGLKSQSLKQRLGVIPANGSSYIADGERINSQKIVVPSQENETSLTAQPTAISPSELAQ